MGRLKKLRIKHILRLNFSPDIIRDTKLRQMTRAGHVERMGEIIFHKKFWFENLRLEETEVNRKIIFQRILRRGGLTNWTGFNWVRTGISGMIL
jgi:hypothetical protein